MKELDELRKSILGEFRDFMWSNSEALASEKLGVAKGTVHNLKYDPSNVSWEILEKVADRMAALRKAKRG